MSNDDWIGNADHTPPPGFYGVPEDIRCAHGKDQGECSECWDEEREDYANLADEMSDPDVGPWVESDWDEQAVANGKRYAEKHGLSWPPRTGDFDRWYDQQHNKEER